MPFNPDLPAPNSLIASAELRDQFNGLKEMIDPLINQVADLADAHGNRLNELESQIVSVNNELVDRPTITQMNDTIFDLTSGGCAGVNNLGVIVSDPPTQGEMQTVVDKIDELLNALKRI